MIKNKNFAFVFRLAALMIALIGLLSRIGVFKGTLSFDSFMFYTIQSNLLAVVLFVYLSVRTAMSLKAGFKSNLQDNPDWHPRLVMIVAVDLLVTLIVFWALLTPVVPASYLWTFENITIHTLTPLLCLLDFILFSERGRLKYRDVYFACIFPVFYVIFATITGFAGYVYNFVEIFGNQDFASADTAAVRFPYFFLDYDRLGLTVLFYIGGMLAFFLLLAHLIYFVDRKVKGKNKY